MSTENIKKNTDLIFITQAEIVNYNDYSKLPVDRLELYSELIFPRMVHFKGKFRSHLDVINYFEHGQFYDDADYANRRKMLNIWNLPGMNSLHLANYLLQDNIHAKVVNNFDSEWDLLCEYYEQSQTPPLVAVSTTMYLSYVEIRRITRKIRKKYPKAEIVLGGAFVNGQVISGDVSGFEKKMREYGVKYIIHSFHSDTDLRDLIFARQGKKDIKKVKNLVYLDGEDLKEAEFKVNEIVWHSPLLDEAPILWDKLELPFVNTMVQTRTAASCPFSCSFCSYPTTAGKFKTMSIENVERNIQSLLNIKGVNKIIFVDDTFNVPLRRFNEMCQVFKKYDFEWFSFLRVQYIDDETAQLMKESGCRGVFLGVESANDVVLKNMNKKATRADFLRGMEILDKYDIMSVATFIIGFPGESEQSIKDNIDFIENTSVRFYTLKEFYYIEHTAIHQQREQFGLTGMGPKWKHDTMDSAMAHHVKMDMFRSIKNAVFIDPDTSLWYLAYLYDQGYTVDEMALIQNEINRIMLDQVEGRIDDNHPGYERLKTIIKNCQKNTKVLV